MRSLPARSLAGCGLLLMALTVQAQDYDRGRSRDDHDDRAYGQDGQYYRRGAPSFQRIQGDLNYAESHTYPSHGQRKQFNKAKEELWEFERAWNAGRFDRRELDDAIAAMQKVVDHTALRYRDREILLNDLEMLREFRASYRGYAPPRW